MIWGESWELATQALRANKVRAALTMLGVIIGSACIVLVVTVALAGKRYIIGQIEAVGSNIVYAQLQHTGTSQPMALADQISLSDLDAFRRSIPQVVEVAGTHDIPMTIVSGGAARPVSLVGVTPGFQLIRNLVIFEGRYFDNVDFEERSKVCLLTQHLANLVYPYDNPIGQTIHIGELSFTIVGVFRERVATFGQTEITTDSVLVPFPLVSYYTGEGYIKTSYAQADRAEDVPLVTQEITQILKSRHRVGAKYNVQNLTSILEIARHISLALTIVLLLIALFALSISGIGIMNIMLVTVTERTREIGIRKAIGAQRSEILYQFLMEAFLISGAGGLGGIATAVLLRFLAQLLVGVLPIPGSLNLPVSWLSVVLAFVVSCATGVLFGYLPASKAAKLQPVESLRYE